jgi:hypothetical protein
MGQFAPNGATVIAVEETDQTYTVLFGLVDNFTVSHGVSPQVSKVTSLTAIQ